MSNTLSLKTTDGHQLDAYLAKPSGSSKGGVVLLQEIFGVNDHIRSVCDRYAANGFTTIAPALFDRKEKAIELNYDEAGIAKGLDYKNSIPAEDSLRDIEAAIAELTEQSTISVIGYCWGGFLSYMAACKLNDLSKAVCYYGGGIPAQKTLAPQIPTLLHFGEEDHAIPMDSVQEFIKERPETDVHLYKTGHGFNCDARAGYNKAAAILAESRTLAFITGA
ncbi:MAG: dienelactone hydrolase family protein [Sneathiellales bacterium]|nr:dienelactone hydrolase family protein [Sneathiellales bacterium]